MSFIPPNWLKKTIDDGCNDVSDKKLHGNITCVAT